MTDPRYFDFNATTPLLPEVVEAMTASLREHFGNPSSSHVFGRRAKAAVERAREQVAALLSCSPDEVLFTSGGTESNNLAICGLTADRPPGVVFTSVVEHSATSGPVRWLEQRGWSIQRAPVDALGRCVVPAALPGACFVTVMHSNNETGVLQPIAELVRHARESGGLVHTDASQSVGKVEVGVKALGVDALTVCGHKLYAPKGVGALYVRSGLPLRPFLLGAGHERGLRPGTENVAGVVGLGVAAEIARKTLTSEAERVGRLRDALEAGLVDAIPGLGVHGRGAPRLPNTASVRFPRVSGSALLAHAPEIAASTGSACHDGHEEAPANIVAMGVPAGEALGTVRLSLGRTSGAADVELALTSLVRAWRHLTAAT